MTTMAISELSEFIVSEEEKKRYSEIFVRPTNYNNALSTLRQQGILWVVGPSGVGKRTLALELARTESDRIIYRVPRSISWSELVRSIQQGSRNALDKRLPGISGELFERARNTLLRCELFNSNTTLRALFVDARIAPWQHKVREAETSLERVEYLIDLLYDRHNDNSVNALSLFLQVLSGRFSSEDSLHNELLELVNELELVEEEFPVPFSHPVFKGTFILADALGTVRFERSELDNEFVHLSSLQEMGHFVILTSSDDIYQEAISETRLQENLVTPFKLSSSSYNKTDKVSIFEKLLNRAFSVNRISGKQRKWMLGLLGVNDETISQSPSAERKVDNELLQQLDTWLPLDIYRFIFISLSEAHFPREIKELLLHNTDLEGRIHNWLMTLDDSTKCFIFTLVLLAGHDARELWTKHKEIVAQLRSLNPLLSIPPLGILRQRAYPYITENGPIDFINPQVQKAVLTEVAQTYREYFAELIFKFKQWSIPDSATTPEEEQEKIAQTENTRNAIARMLGEVAKHGLEDVLNLLEVWGSHRRIGIRKTVGIALEQTILDPIAKQQVLDLLQTWSDRNDATEEAQRLKWSVAAALWRISATEVGAQLTPVILQLLSYLATDRNYFVTYSVAYALLKMAHHTPITRMRAILSNLARRGDSKERSTQQTVALTIDEAIRQDKLNGNAPYDLLDRWIALENSNRHFTVAYVLFVGKYIPDKQRYPRLTKLVKTDATALQLALFQAWQEIRGEAEKTLIVVHKWPMLETEVFTLQCISCVIDELSKDHRNIALDLLDKWLISDSPSAQWVAIYTLFGAKGLADEDRYPRLINLLHSNTAVAMSPLYSVLCSDSSNIAWFVLEKLFESEAGVRIRPALASVLDQGVFEESESFITLVCSAQTHMIQWAAIYLLLVVRPIKFNVRYERLLTLVKANPNSFIEALDETLINLKTHEFAQEIMEYVLNENGLIGRKEIARAIDSAAINDQPKAHCILTNWESRSDSFQWTLIYILLTGVHALERERYSRLSRLIVQNPSVFVHALHKALNDNDTKERAWGVLEGLLKTESNMGQSVALALTNAAGNDTSNVAHLLGMWCSSSNKALRWASIYTSLVAENLPLTDKLNLIVPIMTKDVLTFILAVQSAFFDQASQRKSLVVLAKLADPIHGNRKLLVSAFLQGYSLQPETMQELCSTFRLSEEMHVATLPVETDAEIIKSVITQPSTYQMLGNLSLSRFFEAIRFNFNNRLYQP